MKTSLKKVMLVVTFLLFSTEYNLLASELVHEFKNPAFSGNGYSQHVLSVDQLETTRKQQVKDDEKSAAAAAERAEKNKTINKFITNVESRIYANLSKQLVDNMFGTTCDSSTTTCPMVSPAPVGWWSTTMALMPSGKRRCWMRWPTAMPRPNCW